MKFKKWTTSSTAFSSICMNNCSIKVLYILNRIDCALYSYSFIDYYSTLKRPLT